MFFIESKAYHILTKTSSLAMCSPQAHTSPPNTFGNCSKNIKVSIFHQTNYASTHYNKSTK